MKKMQWRGEKMEGERSLGLVRRNGVWASDNQRTRKPKVQVNLRSVRCGQSVGHAAACFERLDRFGRGGRRLLCRTVRAVAAVSCLGRSLLRASGRNRQ